MTREEPTRRLSLLESVAINPDAYDKEKLLTAFRAGNIAIAHELIRPDTNMLRVRDLGISVDVIGAVLAKRWKSEGHKVLEN